MLVELTVGIGLVVILRSIALVVIFWLVFEFSWFVALVSFVSVRK